MLTSDLNLSKNCKRIEILKCVLKNVHYYYYYYYYKTKAYSSNPLEIESFISIVIQF